jgi:hypothetical protein
LASLNNTSIKLDSGNDNSHNKINSFLIEIIYLKITTTTTTTKETCVNNPCNEGKCFIDYLGSA